MASSTLWRYPVSPDYPSTPQRIHNEKPHRLISSLIVTAASLAAVTGAQAQTNTSASGTGFSVAAPGNNYIGLGVGKSDFKLGNGLGIFDSDQGDTSQRPRR